MLGAGAAVPGGRKVRWFSDGFAGATAGESYRIDAERKLRTRVRAQSADAKHYHQSRQRPDVGPRAGSALIVDLLL